MGCSRHLPRWIFRKTHLRTRPHYRRYSMPHRLQARSHSTQSLPKPPSPTSFLLHNLSPSLNFHSPPQLNLPLLLPNRVICHPHQASRQLRSHLLSQRSSLSHRRRSFRRLQCRSCARPRNLRALHRLVKYVRRNTSAISKPIESSQPASRKAIPHLSRAPSLRPHPHLQHQPWPTTRWTRPRRLVYPTTPRRLPRPPCHLKRHQLSTCR